MVVQNEKEEGEVTDDEEEYLPVPQKRCADDIVTVTPNIEDLRLAVFRSVVQRKLSEKKVVTKTALSSFFAKTKHVKEFHENDGSSSDMEVETWEKDEEVLHQEDFMPEALKALNTTVCEAITASVSTTVNEQSANLDCGSSMIINERRNLSSVVFYFKADERLDSFGLGLKEQMRRKKAKTSAANSAVIENQRLAASFSFWSADTPQAEITSGDRLAKLRSTAPRDGMEFSSLAVLPIECVPSVGSASSAKSATIAPMQPRTAVVRPNTKDSLALAEISSAAPLTAAQQRMKMVEDIARLKLEILMREKKNKAKDSGAINVEDFTKLSRARAQASRVTASQSALALLQSSSDSIGTVAIYNTGGKMPIQTKTFNDSTLTQVATYANNADASSESQLAILPSAREGQTIPSVQGPGQGQSQTEEALRAAALVSRKKSRREDRAFSVTESRAIEGMPSSLTVAAALSAPLPFPIPVPVPLLVPVQRAQHTLYPSSRTRLGFSLFGAEHLPLAVGLPSPPLPPSPLPPPKSQKPRKNLIAPSTSSSSTFGQNRRYIPTRTSSEDPPNASALFSTLMDIGVGLRAPSSSSSRSSLKRLSVEGERKGREKSIKTKMSSKMKVADGLQNDRSVVSTPMEEEIYSHSTGTWTGSGTNSSSRGLHIPPPPDHAGYGSLTQASIGHGSEELGTLDHSRTALYGIWDSNGLDYSYGQHDSLSQLLSLTEQQPEDWYAPPDPGFRTHQRRQEGVSSRPRPPQVTLPPPPPPVHTHLSEDFIQRVRHLKQQKLRSSNTVASVSTDSELEFGEIFEADRSTDGNFVTPRDRPACLIGSHTDMSVEEEIAADADVEVEVEVGADTCSVLDLDQAAQRGSCSAPEGLMSAPIFEVTAALLCSPAGMVGIQLDSSCSSPGDIELIVQSDSIFTSVGDVPITVPDIISVSVSVSESEIIPVLVNGTASLLVSDLHDIAVTSSTDSNVITAVVEVPLSTSMQVANSSASSSASATEMRALKLREAELKTALEVKKIGRAIETHEKLYMYQVSKLTKARALTNRMREAEAESGAMVMKIREEQSQCILRATKADLSRIELLTELSSARMQLSMMKDAESVLRSTTRKPDRIAISAGTGSTTTSSASSSASASASAGASY